MDVFQILLAATKAAQDNESGKLKTQSLSTEIVYNLSPTNNVKSPMTKTRIKKWITSLWRRHRGGRWPNDDILDSILIYFFLSSLLCLFVLSTLPPNRLQSRSRGSGSQRTRLHWLLSRLEATQTRSWKRCPVQLMAFSSPFPNLIKKRTWISLER